MSEKITDFDKNKDLRIKKFYDSLQVVVDQETNLPYATMFGVLEVLKANLMKEMNNAYRGD